MNRNITVKKRNGHREPCDLDKIHRIISWAAEELNNVSVSQIELNSHIQFYNGIVFTALLLISEIIIERRQKLYFIYISIQKKLYVERPRNRSPPRYNLISHYTY